MALIESVMQIHAGGRFDLKNIRKNHFNISDIAHALSNQCRFAGHCDKFYSVAQHSVLVSELVSDPNLKKKALLHDAPEYIIGDLVSPIKRWCDTYKLIEDELWAGVCDRYGMSYDMPEEIKEADKLACVIELDSLFEHKCQEVKDLIKQYEDRRYTWKKVVPLEPEKARGSFLKMYTKYSKDEKK